MSRSSTEGAPPEDSDWYRASQGRLRAYFRARDGHPAAERLQAWLDRAAIQRPVDAHLATAVRVGVIGALGGGLLGLVLVAALAAVGALPGGVLGGIGFVVLGSVAGCLVGCCGYLLYPRVVAARRARRTQAMLPHASLFLFALVHGGTELFTVLDDLADAEEVYGEVAVEFDRLVTDLEWLGVDLLSGIDRAAERAPHPELADFFEELGNVLETGGNARSFLEETVDSQIERAADHLEDFLDTVEVIAEAYIVLVFAGPIFMFVTLTIVSFFDPAGLTYLHALVYLYIPAGVVGTLWVFGRLVGPLQFSLGRVSFDTTADGGELPGSTVTSESDRFERLRGRVRRFTAQSPRAALRSLHTRTGLVFLGSLPLALVVTAVVVLAAGLPVGIDALYSDPVPAGTAMVAVPFAVATLPVAAVYEWNRRRVARVRRRFPTALRIVADATRNGVPLGESFEIVAESTSDPLGSELARVRRDITWFSDIDRALRTFADRLKVPAVSRVVFLLTASLDSTNDIAPIADVVARDLETRNDLIERRHDRMQSYVVAVFVGVLVFLVIVAMFEVAFLPTLARLAGTGIERAQGMPLRVDEIEVLVYRRLLFHAALIQAVGNGLLLGKMADNDVYSGLKYANVLLLFVIAMFWALL